jgi:hypothetical protein
MLEAAVRELRGATPRERCMGPSRSSPRLATGSLFGMIMCALNEPISGRILAFRSRFYLFANSQTLSIQPRQVQRLKLKCKTSSQIKRFLRITLGESL